MPVLQLLRKETSTAISFVIFFSVCVFRDIGLLVSCESCLLKITTYAFPRKFSTKIFNFIIIIITLL